MRENFVGLLLGGLPWRRLHTDLEALPFGSETVLGRTLRAYREAGASRIVLVSGPRTEALQAAIEPHRDRIEWVESAETETRLAPALSAGARALRGATHPIAVGFADMPLLTGELLTGLFKAFRETGRPIGVPICQEQLGHPVFFLPELVADLARLSGTANHRTLVFARGEEVAVLETPQTAVLRTIEGAPEYREMLLLARLPLTPESRF
jgi:CTP:molybdopterin cytidylyltransferase MocA